MIISGKDKDPICYRFSPKSLLSYFLIAIVLVICPLKAHALTLSEEKKLGREYLRIIKKRFQLVTDEEIVDYINSVGYRVAKHIGPSPYKFQFFVIDDGTCNAFAIPGGYIFLFRGIIELMDSEAELASIICHEIGHIQARHIERKMERAKVLNIASAAGVLAAVFSGLSGKAVEGVTTSVLATTQALELKYSRSDEEEADRLGFGYLCAAGYDPQAMVKMMKKLYQTTSQRTSSDIPPYLLTHPAMGERIGYVSLLVKKEKKLHPRSNYLPPIGDFPIMRAALISQYSDLKIAQGRLQVLLTEKHERVAALYGFGRLALRRGRTEEAFKYLKKALSYRPQSPMILSCLGWSYYLMGQLKEAESSLKTALAINPDLPMCHYRLAKIYQNLGEFGKALKELKSVEAMALAFPRIDYELGVTYGRLKNLGKAHYYLGQYYHQEERPELATFHFKEAKRLLPPGDPLLQKVEEALKEE